MKRISRLVLPFFVGLALAGPNAQKSAAAVFVIPDGDVAALKNAITTANNNGEDDTIVLAANGTYTLTTADKGSTDETGLPTILSDNYRKLTIQGNGAAIRRSMDHGTPPFRMISVYLGTLILGDLTIANGGLPVDIDTFGGGIYNDQGTLVLDHCVLQNNQAKHGGGIYFRFAPLTITNSTITGNFGAATGGGIESFAAYNLAIDGCTFANNSAPSGGAIRNVVSAAGVINHCNFIGNHSDYIGGGISYESAGYLSVINSTFEGNTAGGGGAIANTCSPSGYSSNVDLTVRYCRFTNNSATSGGAIYDHTQRFSPNDGSAGVSVTVFDSEFEGNSASSGGGAIYSDECCGQWRGRTGLSVTTSNFNANSARDGGAIYVSPSANAPAIVTNSTFVGNVTYADVNTNPDVDGGGAVYCRSFIPAASAFTLKNCTLSGNSAPFHGGGIFLYETSVSRTIFLDSTILKIGASGENIYKSGGTIASQGYNLSNDSGGGFLTSSGDQTNTDPMLDPAGLQNNGGPTKTVALQPGSPAIDSGDPNAPSRDQRYYLRSGAPDKGAFEYAGTISPLTVVSRKSHGPPGMFDVDLPLDGNTGVECRSGGASGDHQLVLTFATPVTIDSANVTTGTGSVSNFTVNDSQVTLDLTGVSNAQQIVLTVSGVNDGANMNYVIVPMRVLLGDTTGNSMVNASDVSQTKSQVGQAVTNSNFRTDANLTGTITASDVGIVKSKVGTVIPIPLEAAAAR